MREELRKAELSYGCVHAIASKAGYTIQNIRLDIDSIDMTIKSVGADGTSKRPTIDVQLKCSTPKIVTDNEIRFPLKLKNYNDLIDSHRLTPQILIVMIVPEQIDEWMEISTQEILIRHCCYWKSLRGMKATTNSTSVTIAIPTDQIFTASALSEMMKRVNSGGLP